MSGSVSPVRDIHAVNVAGDVDACAGTHFPEHRRSWRNQDRTEGVAVVIKRIDPPATELAALAISISDKPGEKSVLRDYSRPSNTSQRPVFDLSPDSVVPKYHEIAAF